MSFKPSGESTAYDRPAPARQPASSVSAALHAATNIPDRRSDVYHHVEAESAQYRVSIERSVSGKVGYSVRATTGSQHGAVSAALEMFDLVGLDLAKRDEAHTKITATSEE